MKERDILLHHPYNNFEPVLQLLEQAAEDPKVLSIKLTIYRLAKKFTCDGGIAARSRKREKRCCFV